MPAERRSRRFGLRMRIALLAMLAVGAALVAGAVLVVGLLRSRLDDAATTAAELRARDVAALAGTGSLPATLALPGEESAFVQVVDASGTVLVSSENVDGELAVSTVRPTVGSPMSFTVTASPLGEPERLRIAAIATPTPSGTAVVYAGESLEHSEETITAIAVVLAGGVPLIVIVVGCVTWWAVGRTLRPVRSITAAVADITASDLHRRVPATPTRDEIGELAAAVNVTLARLDASVERQRRFVADASHELRGPLASLRADLEISLTHPSSTDWSVVAADTLSDVERLQLLTEDLLVLARIDARHELRRHPVDLAAVASDAVTAIRRDGLAVTTSGISSPAMMTGDRDQLTRMIRNLVRNAEVHATTRVDVSLHALGASLQLVVADDGPGIPAADRTRVFERFVRLDDARTRDEGGTGLGLSIAHDVVLSHRGSIEVAEPSPGRLAGATLVVTLPCRPPERFAQR